MRTYEPKCGCRPNGNLYDTSAPLHNDLCPGPWKSVAQGVLPTQYERRYSQGELDLNWIAKQAWWVTRVPTDTQNPPT